MRKRRKKEKKRGGGNGKRGGRGCGGGGGGEGEGEGWRGGRGSVGPRHSFHTSSANVAALVISFPSLNYL